MDSQGLIKHREIAFSDLQADPNPADTAAEVLIEFGGVTRAQTLCPTLLCIEYDVRQITLEQIEKVLEQLGFHLDGRLLLRLKRALYRYTEETQRANLGCTDEGDCTSRVFASRYGRREHGCQDDRPDHWRRYL